MNEMQKLVEEINKHNRNYYTLDNPTISDKEYDALYDRLVQMGKETAGGKSGSREKQYRHLKEESGARDREGATDMGGSGMFGKS